MGRKRPGIGRGRSRLEGKVGTVLPSFVYRKMMDRVPVKGNVNAPSSLHYFGRCACIVMNSYRRPRIALSFSFTADDF